MMRVADSSARSRIVAASVRPSVSGMRASSSTSAYGRPQAAPCQRASRAASPSPTAAGSICQPRSHSSRMWRLVALSSTISTGRLWSRTGGRAATGSGGCGCRPNRAVKAKVLPRPGSLSTVIVPPIRATSRAAMVRPSPVPPYLPRGRGVLLLEGPEDRLLLVRRDADAGVAHGEAQADLALGCGLAGGLHAHDHLALRR